eukprot:CAMPEP_0202706434 /NCGR_PEP_ID=MMETSP1385-20130828/18855_1 /ASSEMBLY_ACC=CAM_ASM_000861 /TAXON_ID=933848 /ORGANISM="Elphidium margaritaceum" /LENGTH=177 /DNA_ID=CAMNT_0049364899 /DNA_START=15 /DNA_END=548 /DNA_ORIENTATION=+
MEIAIFAACGVAAIIVILGIGVYFLRKPDDDAKVQDGGFRIDQFAAMRPNPNPKPNRPPQPAPFIDDSDDDENDAKDARRESEMTVVEQIPLEGVARPSVVNIQLQPEGADPEAVTGFTSLPHQHEEDQTEKNENVNMLQLCATTSSRTPHTANMQTDEFEVTAEDENESACAAAEV